MKRALCVAAVGMLVSARWAVAQCPDGTPPPCPAHVSPHRDPPLDDRAWLVLPFDTMMVARARAALAQLETN